MFENNSRERLFRMAANGNIEAFEKLIDGFDRRVYAAAFNFTGSEDDAFEISQEVFVRVFEALSHMKNEQMLPFYIYRTAADLCLKYNGVHKKEDRAFIGRAT